MNNNRKEQQIICRVLFNVVTGQRFVLIPKRFEYILAGDYVLIKKVEVE